MGYEGCHLELAQYFKENMPPIPSIPKINNGKEIHIQVTESQIHKEGISTTFIPIWSVYSCQTSELSFLNEC